MIGYEFYWCDAIKGYTLVGMLAERRRDGKRITHGSIMNLARKLVGEKAEDRNIFFLQIKKDDTTGRVCRSNPPFSNETRV